MRVMRPGLAAAARTVLFPSLTALAALTAPAAMPRASAQAQPTPRRYTAVTAERLLNPADGDWPMIRRTYDGWGYSPLDEITPANVARLRPAWVEVPDEPEGISGTVQYMAPEQARGETQRIDPRTDVFGMGAVLYFLLVGRAPFADESILASLERARRCDFEASALRRAGVPRPLEAVCLRAMQAEPADRYASAEAMAADLDRFVGRPRRWKRALGAAAGLVLVLLLAASVWMMRSDEPGKTYSVSEASGTDLLGRPLRHDFGLKFEVLGHAFDNAGEVVLTEGERAVFRIQSDRDCYVGIWHVDGENVVTQLFPNDHDRDHFVSAAQPRTIPGEMEYAIRVTASEGREYLHVVASTLKWEAPLGEQHGPYVVFATPEELDRWRQVRGMILDDDRSPAVAEQLVLLTVRANQ